jgi:hypothetical protein
MSCIINDDVSRKTKRDENHISVRGATSMLRRDENADMKVEAAVKRPRLLSRVVLAPTPAPTSAPTDSLYQYMLMCEYSKKQYQEACRANLDEVREGSDDYGF